MKNNSLMPDQNSYRRLPHLKGAPGMPALCGFLGWMLMIPAAMAGNSAKFTATLLQSTCDITFLNGNALTSPVISGTLPLQPTNSAALSNCGSTGASSSTRCIGPTTPVTVKLTGCGPGAAGKVPTVTLKGTNAAAPEVTSPNAYMFRDAGAAGGNSREYFLVVGTAPVPAWGAAQLIKTGQAVIDASQGTGGGAGKSGNDAWRTLYLGVSCGSGNCNLGTTKSGKLNASLEFSFEYQ